MNGINVWKEVVGYVAFFWRWVFVVWIVSGGDCMDIGRVIDGNENVNSEVTVNAYETEWVYWVVLCFFYRFEEDVASAFGVTVTNSSDNGLVSGNLEWKLENNNERRRRIGNGSELEENKKRREWTGRKRMKTGMVKHACKWSQKRKKRKNDNENFIRTWTICTLLHFLKMLN